MLKQPPHIPNTPGVYIFRKGKTPLYIGKAADLKKRLISYWRKNTGQKAVHLLNEATGVEWIEAASETDALLKEAGFIKQHIPKYNIVMRDDKNYFYVGITKERFPRIFLTHQPFAAAQIQNSKFKIQTYNSKVKIDYIGPFTSGAALKNVLRFLRKLFPYCTCKRPHKRPCLNAQIGRCPGFCCDKSKLQSTNYKLQNEYNLNIKSIISVLSSKRKRLLKDLKKQMRISAKSQDFEKAAKLRDQIAGLENIFSHRYNLEAALPSGSAASRSRIFAWERIERNIKSIFGANKKISRVEGYDISNIFGTEATGSMVVFFDGLPAKSEYRKFKIKTVHQSSDVDMLKEVIRRRIRHKEWGMPDLMLIDGGKPQLNAVKSALRHGMSKWKDNIRDRIFLAGLAKKEEELYLLNRQKPIRLDSLPPATAHFFQRVRDESHRFAKKYHHKLREILYRRNS